MAFLLRYENVAWFSDGAVRILDRRIYPVRVEFVTCNSHTEVAQAITDMVTQSGGPYFAAAMGMVLAAYETREASAEEQIAFLTRAAHTLSHARPTTSAQMQRWCGAGLEAGKAAIARGDNAVQACFNRAIELMDQKYLRYEVAGRLLAEKLPHGGTVMTQCFGETVIGMLLRACRERQNEIKMICAETRPYFQGARLTASCGCDMGFDVTVVTDNMPAWAMKQRKVDLFTSASDVITMDGYIVNKIGTLQMALAARYWEIPYYVTGTPDRAHPTVDSIVIEERDPAYVLEAMGIRTVMEGVKGYYPAFDITPPKLCDGVVTDQGIFPPTDLAAYYQKTDHGLAP